MEIKHLIENTTLTLQQITAYAGSTYKRVWKVWKTYPVEYRRNRKTQTYRNSKLGDLNPMKGKCGEDHHYYKGVVGDNKGYLMRLKPAWYTGRAGSKHVFEHSIVVCEHLGITEVPKGWCVHHCDQNPHNNVFDNLVMMKTGDHSRLHRHMTDIGVTTMPKGSTLKWVEAHGTPWRG